MATTTGRARSFLGGLNLPPPPGRRRRFNASVPLARLDADAERLDLHCLGLPRLPRLVVARPDVVGCFRLRPVPPFVFGVGFEVANGDVAYFWTVRPRRTLAALAGLGYPVAPPRWVRWRHLLGFAG
jgi:hypothetical protein